MGQRFLISRKILLFMLGAHLVYFYSHLRILF